MVDIPCIRHVRMVKDLFSVTLKTSFLEGFIPEHNDSRAFENNMNGCLRVYYTCVSNGMEFFAKFIV